MNRTLFVALAIVCGVSALIVASKRAESGAADALVRLQQSTPGTQQIGHANLSGRIKAGSFQGTGTLLTNLDAGELAGGIVPDGRLSVGGDLLGPLSSTTVRGLRGNPISPALPAVNDVLHWNGAAWAPTTDVGLTLPFTGTANVGGAVFTVTNLDSSQNSSAIFGSGASSGTTFGVRGNSGSTDGSGVYGLATASSGIGTGVLGQTSSSSGRGVWGIATSASGFPSGVYGQCEAGYGLYGLSLATSGTSYGAWAQSVSTSGKGVYGFASASTGANFGAFGQSASNSGTGVCGFASALTGSSYGGLFQSASDSGKGVYGLANSGSGTTYGGYFESASTSGTGIYGIATAPTGSSYAGYFRNSSSGGTGVYAVAESVTSNTTYGIYGATSSQGNFSAGIYGTGLANGIIGESSSETAPFGYGVTGRTFNRFAGAGVLGSAPSAIGAAHGVAGSTASSTGAGVYGSGPITGVRGYASDQFNICYGVTGSVSSPAGRAVYGVVDNTQALAVPYGVLGDCSLSNSGFAVYAVGDMGASGLKPFRIDHPTDPENKYLLHYATESPFPQNFYSGNVVTDSKGYAWVQLPDYFDEINTDYKYQLTVIGKDFAQAIVSEEIVANRFQIRTSAPNVKVSWRVEADRNDRYVQRKRPKDVVKKEGAERGTYQHPELYGMPATRSMNYDPVRDKARSISR